MSLSSREALSSYSSSKTLDTTASETTLVPNPLEWMGRAFGDAVEHAKPRLEALIQALPAAIYTTDAAGRIIFFNEAAAELRVGRLPASNFPLRYNIAPTDQVPIVRVDPRDGERE